MQKRTVVKNIDILERERAVFSKIGFIKHVKKEIKNRKTKRRIDYRICEKRLYA